MQKSKEGAGILMLRSTSGLGVVDLPKEGIHPS